MPHCITPKTLKSTMRFGYELLSLCRYQTHMLHYRKRGRSSSRVSRHSSSGRQGSLPLHQLTPSPTPLACQSCFHMACHNIRAQQCLSDCRCLEALTLPCLVPFPMQVCCTKQLQCTLLVLRLDGCVQNAVHKCLSEICVACVLAGQHHN